MTNGMMPRQLWNQVMDIIKQRVIQPTLWRAMEAAIPITIDETNLVMGFTPGTLHMGGQLQQTINKNAIDRALQEITGKPIQIRVIEGNTLEDWQNVKEREEAQKKLADTVYAKQRQQDQHEKGWEVVMETVQRKFASFQNRQFPQTKARYLLEMIPHVAAEAERMSTQRPDMEEINERQLARVIDRMSTLAEVPSTVIALEIAKIRMTKKT